MSTPPLQPLTDHTSEKRTLPPAKLALRLAVAVLIWLLVNLSVFLLVSFTVFMLLGSTMSGENIDSQGIFTIAVVCAIPPALTASSLIAGRKIFYIVSNRYQ